MHLMPSLPRKKGAMRGCVGRWHMDDKTSYAADVVVGGTTTVDAVAVDNGTVGTVGSVVGAAI
jgi:hypothetical protein